ncbi:MAG: nitric oxide reductase activation protein NorD [Acidimicrobiales bacterium]
MPLHLTEVQRPLGLFAEALAGRVLHLEPFDGDQGGWPWELDLPQPDLVELPAVARPDGGDADQRRLYRMQVLHQVVMTEADTFGDDRAAPDRFAAPRHPLVVASPHPDLAAGLVVILEHHRVTAATRHRYPGARADLDRALHLARERYRTAGPPPDEAGVVTALQLFCRGAGADQLHRWCPRVPPALITWLIEVVAPLAEPAARLEDSARAAATIAARLGATPVGPGTGAEPAPPVDGAPLAGPPGDDPGEPTRDEADGDGLTAAAAPPDGDVDAERADLEGHRDAGALSIAQELEALNDPERPRGPDPRRDPVAPVGDERTFRYDEWDHEHGRYLPAWCRLVERRIEGTDHDFIDGVRRRHAQLSRRIRRQFIRLRPEDRVRVHRQVDGDELDLDAMIEAIVDHRSGTLADDRVTIRRDRAARDVATALLVDLSASTSSPIETPEPEAAPDDDGDGYDYLLDPAAAPIGPPPRRIIDVAKDAVALMCEALEQLGDRHAVYGFSGQGRLDVEFHVSKDFDDPTSPASWAALGALAPIRYTRMGPAIRHAAAKLAAQDAHTRLLIVISDGYPQDIDYGPDRTDRTYGVEDTARAVADAAGSGVDAFCVTIDPAGTDYLGAMFPEHRYLVIDDVESLPSELSKLYLRLAPTPVGRTRVAPGSG